MILIPMPANGNNPNKAVPKKDRKKEGEEAAPAAAPKAEAAPAAEAPKAESAPAAEAPKAEAAPAEAPKAEQHQQQKLLKKKENSFKFCHVAVSNFYTISRVFPWSFK
jgi:nucleoid-associated protein YgaU